MRSQWEIEEHFDSGVLVPLLTDWDLPDANVHAVYLERNPLSVKLRTLIDYLGEHLSQPSGRK